MKIVLLCLLIESVFFTQVHSFNYHAKQITRICYSSFESGVFMLGKEYIQI